MDQPAFRSRLQAIYRKDKHLSSALSDGEIKYINHCSKNNNLKGLRPGHKALLKKKEELLNQGCFEADLHKFYPYFLNGLNLLQTQSSRECQKHVDELHKLVRMSNLALVISRDNWTQGRSKHDNQPQICPTPLPSNIKLRYILKKQMTTLFNKVSIKRELVMHESMGDVRFHFFGNLVIVEHNKLFWVVTFPHIAGLRDCITSQYHALLYSWCWGLKKYPETNLYVEVSNLIEAAHATLKQVNEMTYQVLKVLPSLAIGTCIRDREEDGSFLATITSDLEEKVGVTPLQKFFTRTTETCIENHRDLELCGLWKLFGHPTVNMEASIQDWKVKGRVMKKKKEGKGEEIANMFKYTFSKQYYRQHKQWPKIKLDPFHEDEIPNSIKASIAQEKWDENDLHPWCPSDFKHISFDKNFEFDFHTDPSDLLSDTAIIPSLRHWIYEFDWKAAKTLHNVNLLGPPEVEKKSKRVIIDYLLKEEVSVKDIINIIEDDQIPDDWRVVFATPKEREFKGDNARLFGELCPEMRLYQTVTEDNIASQIFPYVKSQSMTMSEEKLLSTIQRLNATPHVTKPSKGITDPSLDNVFISLDFSSWCSRFDFELATPVFGCLDDLFGFKRVYKYTHLFPMESFYLFADRFWPPSKTDDGLPKPGNRCFMGAEAWLEGLRQKGWTLITSLLIQMACRNLNATAALLGQGDNQVVWLKLPTNHALGLSGLTRDGYINAFMEELMKQSSESGVLIKPEETWISKNLFEYSRKYHLFGCQVSAALKRISRLASEANKTVQTFNTDLSGICSTGSAAAAEDHDPGPAYFCTCMELLDRVREHDPQLMDESDNKSVAFLLVTRVLGGYPISIYPQFCLRSVQDPLTSNLSLIKTAEKYNQVHKFISCWATLHPHYPPDKLSLLKDPTCLPLLQPKQPEGALRDVVDQHMPSFVKNRDLSRLFAADVSLAQKTFVDNVWAIKSGDDAMNPKLASYLYSVSTFGTKEKMIGKFSSSKSIQQIASQHWTDEWAVIQQVSRDEQEVISTYRRRSIGVFPPLPECTTRYAQELREKYWGTSMEGITMPAIQEQCTFRKMRDVPMDELPRTVLLTVQDGAWDNGQFIRGPYRPYFGSKTKVRVKKAPLQTLEVSTVHNNLIKILELLTWVSPDGELKKLLERMVEEKTTMTLEELQKFTPRVYSGSLTHRLPVESLSHGGMMNHNLTFGTHVQTITDTATDFSKSCTNYSICFQSVLLYGISRLLHLFNTLENATYWGLTFNCNDCTFVLGDEQYKLDSCTYQPQDIGLRITELTPRSVHYHDIKTGKVDRDSYSVHMGRRFALWIQAQGLTDFITGTETQQIGTIISASFVNRTELQRLNIDVFFKSFVFYLSILKEVYFTNTTNILQHVNQSGCKSPFDVLIDSLVVSGLLPEVVKYVGNNVYFDLDTRMGMRGLLRSCLHKVCMIPISDLFTSSYILSPHDSLNTIKGAIYKRYRSTNSTPPDLSIYTEVTSLIQALPAHMKPSFTGSESELVECVRAMDVVTKEEKIEPVDRINFKGFSEYYKPVDRLTQRLVPLFMSGDEILPALLEIAQDLREWVIEYEITNLYTLHDKGGGVFAFLKHWMPVKGAPSYPAETDDIESLVQIGPTQVICDPCVIEFSRVMQIGLSVQTANNVTPYLPHCLVWLPKHDTINTYPSNCFILTTIPEGVVLPQGYPIKTWYPLLRPFQREAICIISTYQNALMPVPSPHPSQLSCLPHQGERLRLSVNLYDLYRHNCFSLYKLHTSLLGGEPKTHGILADLVTKKVEDLSRQLTTLTWEYLSTHQLAHLAVLQTGRAAIMRQILAELQFWFWIASYTNNKILAKLLALHIHFRQQGLVRKMSICWLSCTDHVFGIRANAKNSNLYAANNQSIKVLIEWLNKTSDVSQAKAVYEKYSYPNTNTDKGRYIGIRDLDV